MSGWSIKEFFDEVIFELYNLFNFFAAFKYKKYLEKIHLDCTAETETNLILNGPSSVDIKVEDCKFNFFVNYGYKHPLFSKVKSPKYIWMISSHFAALTPCGSLPLFFLRSSIEI